MPFRESWETFKASYDFPSSSLLKLFKNVDKFLDKQMKNLKLSSQQAKSSASYCGVGFKKNDLLYHCSDCALDETCVMCENCFVYEAHKDHNYWYTICSEASGGSCDCGEEDSWRHDLMCPKHATIKTENSEISNPIAIKDNSRELILNLLVLLSENIQEYTRKKNVSDSSSDKAIVLYNDERHSFGDVISVLSRELQVSEDAAHNYATLVDQNGFAVVYQSSSLNTLERLARKISASGLVTSIETHSLCLNMALCTQISKKLVPLLEEHSGLRQLVVDWLLGPVSKIEEEVATNLELILVSDHLLWKSLRVDFNDTLNLCNSINQFTKKNIAEIYCNTYDRIFDAYLKEKREPELSVIRFSVQLFTLIPVAEHCVNNTEILSTIFSKLSSILEAGFDQKSGLKFSNIRNFEYNKITCLLHDALQILRNLGDGANSSVMDISVLEPFIYCLFMLSNFDSHVKKTGEHVEYERDNFDAANYICYEMQKISRELVRFAVCSSEVHLIWTLLDKYISQSSTYQLYLKEDKLPSPLYKSKRPLSFFGSLSWFWGTLMLAAYEKGCIKQLLPPFKFLKLFAKDSLTRLLFHAEVRSNLWVRNGAIMSLQDYFYSGTVYYHLTYVPDVFNCIVLAMFMDLDPYIKFLIDQSALFAYFEESDQNVSIIEQILVILISSITKTVPILDDDQTIINALCVGDQTRGLLVRSLPDSIADKSDFKQRVFQFSAVKYSNALGSDASLELKPEAKRRFDPFYWALPMDLRMKGWVSVCQKNSFSLKSFIDVFKDRYEPSENVTVAYKTLNGILSHLLQIDSSKFEFVVAATLFCILMLPESFFDSKNSASISKAVVDLKAKPNIPPSFTKLLDEFQGLFSAPINAPQLEEKVAPSGAKSLSIDRKASIMASFKSRRSTFFTENVPETTDSSDSPFICVVCSGTQSEEDNEFGLPVQLNMSKLLYEYDAEFIKGCCHVFHRRCFEGLRGRGSKTCPLCNSCIDLCIPIADDSVVKIDSSFLSKLSGELKDDDFQAALKVVNREQKPQAPPPPLFSRLCNAYCYTLAVLSSSNRAPESIPPQLISTLGSVKRFIFAIGPIEPFIEEMVTSHSAQFFMDCESVFRVFVKLNSGQFDEATAAALIKFLVSKNEVGAQQFSKQFEYIIHMIMNDSPSRDEERIFSLPLKKPDGRYPSQSLIKLPDRFDVLLRSKLKKRCFECETVPRSPAICLVCGELVCLGDACCRNELGGECRQHRLKCSRDAGVFLLLKNCALLLLSAEQGLIIPAPYLNAFGEHDLDLRSESPLILSHHLYYQTLGTLWSNCEIRDYIARNQGDTRLTTTSWHLL